MHVQRPGQKTWSDEAFACVWELLAQFVASAVVRALNLSSELAIINGLGALDEGIGIW